MFQSLQSSRQKWSQLVILQEKRSEHHKAMESSVQCAQHVPLQSECYCTIVTGIANIIENSIWKTAQAVVAEINFTDFRKALKRPVFNHLQTNVLQIEVTEATEIPKKTFWKCSQFVALQVKFFQTAQIPQKTFWKCSQFVALQVKFFQTAEIPKKTFWKCPQFVALQVKSVQIFQAIKYSSRKLSLSQIHVFQRQGAATPATSTAYIRCSDAINR